MTKQVLVPVAAAASDDASDALWQLSVKKDAQRKSQELNALRLDYHLGQSKRLRRTMTELVEHHEAEARRLVEGEGGSAV